MLTDMARTIAADQQRTEEYVPACRPFCDGLEITLRGVDISLVRKHCYELINFINEQVSGHNIMHLSFR